MAANVGRAIELLDVISAAAACALAIDDSGPGYSSMSLMEKFPVDTIQDRSSSSRTCRTIWRIERSRRSDHQHGKGFGLDRRRRRRRRPRRRSLTCVNMRATEMHGLFVSPQPEVWRPRASRSGSSQLLLFRALRRPLDRLGGEAPHGGQAASSAAGSAQKRLKRPGRRSAPYRRPSSTRPGPRLSPRRNGGAGKFARQEIHKPGRRAVVFADALRDGPSWSK